MNRFHKVALLGALLTLLAFSPASANDEKDLGPHRGSGRFTVLIEKLLGMRQ